MSDILTNLDQLLEARKTSDPSSSYVAQLHQKGLNKILEKVAEEAGECIIAAKDVTQTEGKAALVAETADLWFHSLVMLSHLNLSSTDVLDELKKRTNLSGLAEKAARKR